MKHTTLRSASALLSACCLLALLPLAGCDDKGPPPSATGGGTGGGAPAPAGTNNQLSGKQSGTAIDRLAEEPKSMYGRSAATGRDVARQIENKQAEASAMADEINGAGAAFELAGLKWIVPTRWEKATPANQMRAAEYHAPGESGDPAVVVFSQAGGDVQSNIKRWIGQFRNPETGGEAEFRERSRTVSGVKVHMVDIVGTFKDGMPGSGQNVDRPGYAMRGAIVDGPGGTVFIKMTGPYDAVEATRDEWYQLIDGMTKK